MIDLLIAFMNKVWPPLLALILTHLFIKFKMPQIEINVEKKEGVINYMYMTNNEKGEARAYRAWKFDISNKKMPCCLEWLLNRETATKCSAKIKISGTDKTFIMQGRWDNSPQISHIAEKDRFVRMLFPDPIDIRSDYKETLACIIQFPDDNIAYGWNNEAYFHEGLKTPAYSLKEGQYKALITITPQNGKDVTKEFILIVSADPSKTTLV